MRKSFAAFGEVMMRLEVPEHKLLSQGNELTYSFSGSGVNVLAMLSHLGYQSSLVTTLPENALGEAAKSFIQQLGISTHFVQMKGDYLGKYFLENGFGPRPSRVTYTNRKESSFNTNEEGYPFQEIAKQIKGVHLCGITLAMNEKVRKQMLTFAKVVKDEGGMVVLDCNYRPSLWGEGGHEKARPFYEEILSITDIALMNEKDMIYTLGMVTMKKDRKEQLQELVPKVVEKYNLLGVAGTHRMVHENNHHTLTGYFYKEQSLVFSDAKTFSVLDRIGAGDAFAAGIIHGELQNLSSADTVNFATAAGALAHTIVGDSPILSEEDIMYALKNPSPDVLR